MKNLTIYIFPAAIFLFSFSCDNNESVKKDDKCGEGTAKYIRNWCASNNAAVIELLSDKTIGEDWFGILGKTYHHTVLALLDSTLSKANTDWNGIMNPSDSIFYFNYELTNINTDLLCKMCCPPKQTITITSFASGPCHTGNN
ncbi:MAG: hypothetical protein KF775_16075 [Cyclobacteriaceae bacterium]|nr:hypothetical protein [Cyclobacteriaceae bacterium]